MSALPSRGILRTLPSLALVLAIALAPAAGLAQDDDDDLFSDDFLDEEVEEEEAESFPWFNYPIDILLSRPFAVTDTIVGSAFFLVASPLIMLAGTSGAFVGWVQGDGWYFDRGNLQGARQICVVDPWDYVVNRSLGPLSREY